MQTAINQQTGETAVLIGDKWEKADHIADNGSGGKAYFVGGKWLTEENETLPSPEQPQRGFGGELLRQVGLTARAGIKGVTALPEMVGNALGLKSSQAVDNLLGAVLPTPESGTERIAQDVAGALSGVGATAAAAKLANPLSQVGRGVANLLTENLGTQTAASGAASGASGVTREAGGNEGSQLIAGLVAGVGAPYVAGKVARTVPNMVAKSVRKSDATPFAREGERLANETGIDLTLGQRSGNKMTLAMENAARQYPAVADRVQDIDVKIANQAIQKVSNIANAISTNKVDPAQLGSAIEDTVKAAAVKLDNLRNINATQDYGNVRRIAGDKPVVRMENLANELRAIIDDNKNVMGLDAQKIVAQAQAMLEKMNGPLVLKGKQGTSIIHGIPTTNTINDAMKSRSFYGKASRGAANVFENIASDMNRTIGARLFGAINKDFDAAAESSSGVLRRALDDANGRFKAFSQSIDYLEKSTLGKLVGDDVVDAALSGVRGSTTAGEAVVQKIASAHPSSRKAAIDILERHNPALAKDLRASVLRDALDKGMSVPPSTKGAGQVPISFNKFITALQGEKVGFVKQLESYGFQPNEIKDIRDTVQAMMRAGDRTGFNFSNTQVAKDTLEIAGTLGHAAATGATWGPVAGVRALGTGVLNIAGKRIGLNKIADAMASNEGRKALRTITSPKVSSQAVIAAFETIEGQQ